MAKRPGKKKCVHGVEYRKADASPPCMTGCVICHNMPEVGNPHPYAWPLKSHDEKWAEQAFRDIHTLIAQRDSIRGELHDLEASLDMRWKADMRAIKMWQKKTGRTLTWPDHADMVVFLLEQLDQLRPKAKHKEKART